jgi:hypothetical protein
MGANFIPPNATLSDRKPRLIYSIRGFGVLSCHAIESLYDTALI